MDLNEYKTSKTKETDGVWQPVGGGTEWLVARINNPAAARLMQRYTKPYRRQIEAGTMEPAKQNEILCRVLSEAVLLDWKGQKEDGKTLKYSTQEAYRVLMEYPDARMLLEDLAKDAEAYREREIEEAAGN